MLKQLCPCCGCHCSLDSPNCERGAEYAKTGVIPPHTQNLSDRQRQYLSQDWDNKLIWNLRDIGHTIRQLSEGKASQSRILIMLNETEAITQSELTEHLGVQPGSASEVIGKLESAGLITRTPSEKDRRTADIHLTNDGRIKAEEASEQRKKRHSEMFSALSEEEKQALLMLLEKLNHDWHQRYNVRGRQDRPHHDTDSSCCPKE